MVDTGHHTMQNRDSREMSCQFYQNKL